MATQATQGGKGKKKNKETKISLDEFNQFDAPHGHSVVSLKMTGLDWAEAMADHDSNRTETAQIVVPSKPRAQRGPNFDPDSLPTEPPFKVSLFNVPLSMEEDELTKKHFKDINIIRSDLNNKSSTTLELATKEDLYEALSRDGISIKGRTINVCLFGQQPPNSYDRERYGGRGSGGSYGDRYSDRNQGGGFNRSRQDDRYGDRAGGSGGYSRDRTSYSGGADRGGYNANRSGGYNQQRGGYADRFDRGNFRDNMKGGSYTSGGGEPSSEESNDWRARPNISRQLPPASSTPATFNSGSAPRNIYVPPRPDSSHHQPHHYQPPSSHHNLNQNHDSYHQPRQQHHHQSYNTQQHHHNQSSNHPHYQDHPSQGHNRQVAPVPPAEERPKLVLQKRKTPLNIDDVSSVARNEAIFGAAKPSSKPYEKMKEIEEKLKAVHVTSKKEAAPDTSANVSPTAGANPNQQTAAPRSKNVSESSQQDSSSKPVQS